MNCQIHLSSRQCVNSIFSILEEKATLALLSEALQTNESAYRIFDWYNQLTVKLIFIFIYKKYLIDTINTKLKQYHAISQAERATLNDIEETVWIFSERIMKHRLKCKLLY